VGSSLIAIGLGLAVLVGEIFGVNLFWFIERNWECSVESYRQILAGFAVLTRVKIAQIWIPCHRFQSSPQIRMWHSGHRRLLFLHKVLIELPDEWVILWSGMAL
jgi:hypothetical protein